MKQIYYTQCPIGYGLGASNGFQIKRLDPGYPVSGDFRHFSMRAFVAGTRTMAPAALRYRRGEGDLAEVAWLTPRSHEYETERGAWGRPGGHFAHGLRLEADELRKLCDWPAGLFDRPFWIRSDPVPSRGQPPSALELAAADLSRPPTFTAVAPMAAGEDVELLARLLTAAAAAAREGRTLFLIDEPARLAERIALLTFAFPEPWRAALTFSTYHDRPEELPGFRLQGTIPASRANRAALLAHGFVADLTGSGGTGAVTIEPSISPARWARTLAGWFVRNRPEDQADWEATRRRAGRAGAGATPEAVWAEEWLERVFGLPAMLRDDPPKPQTAREWAELIPWTSWTSRAGLADEWIRARPPTWWRSGAAATRVPEARKALLKQLGMAESWRGDGRAAAWGEAVGAAVGAAAGAEHLEITSAALTATPASARPSFVGALFRALPPGAVAPTLAWLEAQTAWDRSILLPLKAAAAVAATVESLDPGALDALLAEALALPAALPAVLDAVAAEVREKDSDRAVVVTQLAVALAHSEPGAVATVHRWALNPAQPLPPELWLGAYWKRLFSDSLHREAWPNVFEQLPSELHGPLSRVVLGIAVDGDVPPEAFRWGIEALVLPKEATERPHDRTWAGAYVDRLPSGLDLLKRLFAKEYRRLGLRRWLEAARERGELSDAQADRIADCVRYAKVLTSGNARSLIDVKLPEVPAEERGTLLGQILGRLGDGSDESLNLALDSGRAAWPEGFQPGAPGLAALADAVATPLLAERDYPVLWFERLERVVARLRLDECPGQGFEHDGFAAEILAATVRGGEDFHAWPLRRFLLDQDRAWRLLAADVRRELQGQSCEQGLALLERWDHDLDKGKHTARFFEVWLNACEPAHLAAAVAARTPDLKNLVLPWWDSVRVGGANDDIRERFVRQAPLAPLVGPGTLARVRSWLFPSPTSGERAHSSSEDMFLLACDELAPELTPRDALRSGELSEFGRLRWRFLEAVTIFLLPEETTDSRWQRLKGWTAELPLGQLDPIDRNRFLGWLIVGFPQLAPDRIARLAAWLFKNGFTDAGCGWSSDWYDDLAAIGPIDGSLRLKRVGLVGELKGELRRVIRDAAEGPRKTVIHGSPQT
jgi:hypothetical protein